jgi:DNA-binding CsgD family transcriptional regulator
MRTGWPFGWRHPLGRFEAALVLAVLAVAAALVAAINPAVPGDTVGSVGYWRFDIGSSVLLLVGAIVVRERPGLAFPILAFASAALSNDVESMSYAARSVEASGGLAAAGTNADVLLALAVFDRTVIPAAILTLYATAPERRLAPWVSVVAWGITIATIAAPFLRVARDAISRAEPWGTPWWNELSFQLDQPVPLFAIVALGLLGSLRAAAHLHAPAMQEEGPTVTPDRRLLTATMLAAVLWLPATIAYLNRPASAESGMDASDSLAWLPILLALVAIVSVRWSRVIAWCALAATFEAIATLVLYRAIADYIALIQAHPQIEVAPSAGFWLQIAASIGVVLFAFAAVSLAFVAAWRAGPPSAAEERRSAIRGAVLGLAACAWFVTGGFLGAGLGIVAGVVFLPAYLMPVALAIVAWRRLVPAVAEAEAIATNPSRPMRYLETVVAEVLTRRAAHQRRAAFEERDRVASEINDLRATIGRLLTDRTFELAPAGAGPWRAAHTSALQRPSDRELDVVSLVARGASNEAIAQELVLALKTVESHLSRLFTRYGVTNRTELAVLAVREGWVDGS